MTKENNGYYSLSFLKFEGVNMASKRRRASGTWEFIVRNKLLPRTISLSFVDEAEGDAYVAELEANIRAGNVPLKHQRPRMVTIAGAVEQYEIDNAVPISDSLILAVIVKRRGRDRLGDVTYDYGVTWVAKMKREENLKPSTIRHYVGALARCLDWVVNRKQLAENPIRQLPKSYSTYSETDKNFAKAKNPNARFHDESRDRRLSHVEEVNIRWIMRGAKLHSRERPLALRYQGAFEAIFDIGLGSLMRMREMYTLTIEQVDIPNFRFLLEKTKNGSRRQVPMSAPVITALKRYMAQVESGERGMSEFSFDNGFLFPWWDGDKLPATLRKVTAKLSAQFGRIFEAAGCTDFSFHDIRHEATSRLYERNKLSDLEIMKIGGWSSINMLKRYTNLRASDLALKMD
ncbi:tyrosine-type recombinase/integrase [Glaciimonas sp. GNP009]